MKIDDIQYGVYGADTEPEPEPERYVSIRKYHELESRLAEVERKLKEWDDRIDTARALVIEDPHWTMGEALEAVLKWRM